MENNQIVSGFIMTLKEISDKKIMADDILCMIPYPINYTLAPFIDPAYDSLMRKVYFRPGRETKYFKNISKNNDGRNYGK